MSEPIIIGAGMGGMPAGVYGQMNGSDEMKYEVLKGATKSLREDGKLILTTLNGLFPLYHSVEEFCASTIDPRNATYRSNTFDLMTFRDHNITIVEDDNGNKRQLHANERCYVPSEVTWLLKTLGAGSNICSAPRKVVQLVGAGQLAIRLIRRESIVVNWH